MANIFFWSDAHFHHANIIEYEPIRAERWKTVEEMEEGLVEAHNKVVGVSDHSYFLGDFSILRKKKEWPEVIRVGKRLNGHKRIILGNHDHCPVEVYRDAGFEKIRGVWGGIDSLLLTHIPIHPSDMGRFRANLHGHIHHHRSPDPVVAAFEVGRRDIRPYINVSVEAINFTPVSLDEINDQIKKLNQLPSRP